MFIPFGEFAPDQSDHNKNIATQANNCRPIAGHYRSIKDIGDSLHGNISGLAQKYGTFVKIIGNTTDYIITAGATSYSVNGNAFNGASLTTAVSSSYLGPISFIKWGDDLIIAGNGVGPNKIAISSLSDLGVTKTAMLGGTPPACNCAARVRDFLVLGGIYESSTNFYNRVKWSDINNYDVWTVGSGQSDFQDMPDSGFVSAIVGGEVGTIFTENSVVRMTYVGSPIIFQFDEIEGALGTKAGSSVVPVGNDIYYYAEGGFFVLRNGVSVEPISQNLNKFIYENMGYSSSSPVDGLLESLIQGAYDKANNLIYWRYRDINSNPSSTSETNKVVIYDITTGRWTTADYQLIGIFGIGVYLDRDLAPNTFREKSLLVTKFASLNVSTVHYLDGAELAATLETGEISQGVNRSKLSTVRPIIDGTATVTVSTKDSASDTYTDSSATALDSTGKANFRTDNRYHRIKCTTSGAFTQAEGVEVELNPSGKR